ncbi:hypothetical protein OPW36_05535 [Vibrio europaeus]|uniref:Lipoprotein n=1 Tax=Vibrio europaeus TaxID=300876 RepID=A0AAE7DW39_9VIBR|nr:hypothetical protein [Vibrio europaeus]MDC5806564.1 hypothetical protein [Vibrio europaeus]MDC5812881.1 hypothetical protein [Vibrio europaeus]MDC5824179.1 hypothetical protein [Vibrio europaeus]MDC5829934.1 hypothetical protein [Vibrio europaeus]MDC5836789.1 hypothetical protein [Vibrio europaeus]
MKEHLFLSLIAIALVGCSSAKYTVHDLQPLRISFWNNVNLSNLSESEFQFEFSKAKAACKVESLKLTIPSPSCVQPPKSDCTGLSGFELGFCRSFVPPVKCDYTAVNYAKRAQEEIYSNCLISKGWQLDWREGTGSDTSGGRFEYVAFNNEAQFFIKLNSVKKIGTKYMAVVRETSKVNARSSYQGVYVIDTESNTLTVDNGKAIYIESNSVAAILLARMKDLV